MPILLVLLICVGVAGLATAAFVYLEEAARRQVLARSGGAALPPQARLRIIRQGAQREMRLRRLLRRAPSVWAQNEEVQNSLVRAGFDSPVAPLVYAMTRAAAIVVFPVAAVVLLPGASFTVRIISILGALLVGLLLPVWYLMRAVRVRQEKIRRSLPDALDLLVVCVEAGISLDAAILRVARELVHAHPQLAREFMTVNRKTNAGMTREDALRGLYQRTGVEEIRSLVSSLVQSEKWGTSSARVLRVASESLRRRRRQLAEKRAATAPVRMVLPLALLIFPALFVVILGPAMMSIITALRG